MRAFVLTLLLCAVSSSATADDAEVFDVAGSVVEIRLIADAADPTAPWRTEGVEPFGGSGVIIEGNRVLTNAHVVEYAVAIEVKRADESRAYTARVAFISHDADLALLEVDDAAFFRGARPVPIGSMPQLLQKVDVYGFPVGGSTLSITSGIVSRIEIAVYAQSARELLSVQIDAAINSGNSGGPIISAGAIAGIAMQTYGAAGAENVGYMIPAPVVSHFLTDVGDGKYDGFPSLGLGLQQMKSEALRASVGMDAPRTGGLVIQVDYGGPAFQKILQGDVLLAIDGKPVADDLTIEWQGIGRVGYQYALQSKQIGEPVSVSILRDGKTLTRSIVLTPHQMLVPGRRKTERPRYVIFGGLVFQPLNEELLDEPSLVYEDSDVFATLENVVTKDRQEIILLQQVLPDRVNRGYQEWGGEIVSTINGVIPRDLDHVAKILDSTRDRFVRIVVSGDYVLAIRTQAARDAAERILDSYGIAEDRYLGGPSGPRKRPRRRRR